MDLKEIRNIQNKRHPWEIARLKALNKILSPYIFEGINILDVGCGDGFVSSNLFNGLLNKLITAVDLHLTDELIFEFSKRTPDIKYQREMPEDETYDLILLLDVIEHIEYVQPFLTNLVSRHNSGKGKVLITVPAFQSIYGRHDIFLGHYKRYNLNELVELAKECKLNVISSGYLFSSLLLPKLILYKLLNSGNVSEGVGNWCMGRGVTKFIENILDIDNSLLILASRYGIKIPGLTGWVLCEKQG